MRVAVDARELLGQRTGAGRYLAGLLSAWSDLPAAAPHEFVLCAPGPVAPDPVWRVAVATEAGGALGSGTLWEQIVLPRLVRDSSADVLFAPAYTGPLRSPSPMVVAVHDVSFAAHPEWFGRREGLRRRLLTRAAAHRAARVVTISEFSRGEIVDRLGVPAGKVDVAYPGIASAPAGTRARSDLVLYVGSLFNRRHVPEMIEAVGRLARRHPEVRLEVVGDNRTTPRIDFDAAVARAGAAGAVALRSYVPEGTLEDLYGRARAFVFLSDYEGFGLTPLEALAAGVPIVVLDTPVAREVYRGAALYVPSPDPSIVEQALARVLFDAAERARILEEAARLLPQYSWSACAARVLDILTAAARRQSARGDR